MLAGAMTLCLQHHRHRIQGIKEEPLEGWSRLWLKHIEAGDDDNHNLDDNDNERGWREWQWGWSEATRTRQAEWFWVIVF